MMAQTEAADETADISIDTDEYTISPKGDGFKLSFDTLIARSGNEFVFLDYLFDNDPSNPDSGLFGAVGTTMVPISESELQRRKEEHKDPEWSPIAHIWSEMNDGADPENHESEFIEWVEQEMMYGDPIVYDSSYEYSLGETVREKSTMDNISAVECIGGGRMFNSAYKEFDTVYRPDLLMAARYCETYGFDFL